MKKNQGKQPRLGKVHIANALYILLLTWRILTFGTYIPERFIQLQTKESVPYHLYLQFKNSTAGKARQCKYRKKSRLDMTSYNSIPDLISSSVTVDLEKSKSLYNNQSRSHQF